MAQEKVDDKVDDKVSVQTTDSSCQGQTKDQENSKDHKKHAELGQDDYQTDKKEEKQNKKKDEKKDEKKDNRSESNRSSSEKGNVTEQSPTLPQVDQASKKQDFDADSFESADSGQTNPTSASESTSGASNLEELLENLKLDTDEARLVSSLNKLLSQNKATAESPKKDLLKLKTLDEAGVVDFIKSNKCRNVIAMVGAGISTSAGIPDFRSPKSGIYSKLAKYNLPSPECMFEINYFRKNPQPFFELAKELFNNKEYRPTPCHYFIRLLKEKGLLLRLYTQNIDGLEFECGLDESVVVAAHGSFNKSRCLSCGKEYDFEFIKKQIYDPKGELPVKVPRCSACKSKSKNIIKPNIVFFGERLPKEFYELQDVDFPKCDLLLIIGTSLSVQPFAGLIDQVGPEVPRVLINREKRGESSVLNGLIGIKSGLEFDLKNNYRDVFLAGDCDSVCLQFIEKLGWKQDYEQLVQQVKESHANQWDYKNKCFVQIWLRYSLSIVIFKLIIVSPELKT